MVVVVLVVVAASTNSSSSNRRSSTISSSSSSSGRSSNRSSSCCCQVMAFQALVVEQSHIEDMAVETDESFQVCKSQVEVQQEQLLEKVEAKVEKAWRYVVRWELGQRAIDRVPGVEGAGPKPAGGGEVIQVI